MTIDKDNLIESIKASLSRIDYVSPENMPNIDLYMDQVTTFMEDELANTKRYKEDKILTKTMINNYAKNNLLPPPEKKKYSKEHLLTLFFIYYFKNILSINDLEKVLTPITERYFHAEEGLNMEDIYTEVFSLEDHEVKQLTDDIVHKYNTSSKTFEDAPAEDKEFLKTFSFICMLSYDVFVKRLLIEKIIDEFPGKTEKKKEPEPKKEVKEKTEHKK